MCGIAGIVSFNGVAVEPARLKKMTDAIAHRGPDGEGFWISEKGNVGLAHRRLAIIDLSDAGKQPMHYAHNRYVLIFNGEIYNYIELRKTLIADGYTFHSQTDTEVLMALYDQKKEKCLEYIDGMFAFALYDNAEQILFCARDRFGEKPFHYFYDEGKRFVFASEMKAMWSADVPKSENEKMFFNFLTTGSLHNSHDLSQTFYKSIYKLKAGHYLKSGNDGKLIIKKYWDLDYKKTNKNISEKDATEQFRMLMHESVMRRLRSDVTVGSSLSGGLDSSLVVCLIDKINIDKRIKQNVFSARFPGYSRDEGPYMQMVIDRTNVNPYFVFPGEQEFISDLDKLLWHQEEPFRSASIYAQYCVMRTAKQNNTIVLLDGQGADEMLAGYDYFFFHYFLELGKKNPLKLKKELAGYKEQVNRDGMNLGKSFLLKSWLPGMTQAIADYNSKKSFSNHEFLSKDYLEYNKSLSIKNDLFEPNNLNALLYQSTLCGPLENLLRFADRNSMAHSVEVRLPYLLHSFVEFIFSLPTGFKIRNGWRKYIMRISFEDLLPAEITWRKDKIGYEPPQDKWLQNKILQQRMIDGFYKLADKKILNKNSIDKKLLGNKDATAIPASWNYWMASEFID
ncbi:MAG: asparagine synthase (glutamine-hydrolyzing) [Bacteroidia bacterium]